MLSREFPFWQGDMNFGNGYVMIMIMRCAITVWHTVHMFCGKITKKLYLSGKNTIKV